MSRSRSVGPRAGGGSLGATSNNVTAVEATGRTAGGPGPGPGAPTRSARAMSTGSAPAGTASWKSVMPMSTMAGTGSTVAARSGRPASSIRTASDPAPRTTRRRAPRRPARPGPERPVGAQVSGARGPRDPPGTELDQAAQRCLGGMRPLTHTGTPSGWTGTRSAPHGARPEGGDRPGARPAHRSTVPGRAAARVVEQGTAAGRSPGRRPRTPLAASPRPRPGRGGRR